jgi:hypothetical protein
MDLIEILRRRKLSLIGIFLIVMALDFLIDGEILFYDVSPLIGEIFPFYKIEQPTKTLPTFIVKLYSWPFYVPMLLGGTLAAVDIGKIRKEREEAKVELTHEAIRW